jgi:uncharacterized protein YggE
MIIKLYLTAAILWLVATQSGNACCGNSTVTVSGNGKVTGTPDTAIFSVTIQQTANTSKAASAAANQKTTQVLSILANNSVNSSDIQTTQLTISPQYDYTNGTQTLTGQQASQTVNVKVRNISSDGSTVGKLVDALTNVNGIDLSGISFDISNKTSLNTQARQLAFQDAKTKAQQYAQLSGLKLGQVLTITESSSSNNPPVPFMLAATLNVAASAPTQVPVGQYDVSNDVTITFKLI